MNVYLAVVMVAAMWGLLWLVFTGLGLGVRQLFGARLSAASDLRLSLRLAPWVGWCAAIAVLQLWHCLRPVDAWAFAVIGTLGLAGLAWHARPLAALLASNRRVCVGAVALFGLCALWLANHAVMQPGVYDSGLYHLNGIRWAKEYAIVPGLGNLHGRLAYNNSSFLYAAMLDVGPFTHRTHQVSSGFLILLTLLPCVRAAWTMLRRSGARTSATLFEALFLAPLVVWIVNSGYASSPSPDVPAFLLAIVLALEFLRMLEQPRAAPASVCEPFAILCLLAMTGITVKLSFAAYGVAVGVTAFALQWMRARDLRGRLVLLTCGAALTLVIMVPWCARGVVLSGYVAYPSTFGGFPVDWAVSASSADIMVQRIQSWARIPDVPPETVLHTWSWLGPWFRRTLRVNAFDFTAPLATAIIALAVLAWRVVRRRALWRDARWLVLVPALAGDLVWFFAAPDPRYQGAILWVLGIALFAAAWPMASRAACVALAAHALLVLGIFLHHPLDLVRTWKDPGPAQRVPMVARETASGLRVLVPAQGDQAWDSDPPATPYFSKRLQLRVPGAMARGFSRQPVADGARQPEDKQP